MRRRMMVVVGVCLLAGCSGVNVKERAAALAGADVVLRVDAKGEGEKISEQFIGLSFETRKLLPDGQGKYYFRVDDAEMVGLFRSLGVKSLRIGGNTADRATVAIPTNGDLDVFYGFARAAGVKVIYNLRLKNVTDPSDDVRIVKHIMGKYADLTECFTLGNEPDFYFKEYGEYLKEYRKFSAAILEAVPGAKFCGPSTAGHPEWAASMARDVGKPELALLSLHTYPGGNGQAAGDPEHARAHILSPELDAGYQKFYDNFVPGAKEKGLGYRLEECNSLYNGGAAAISNSYASAVWALDFMYWWAGHGAEGVNFHTGTNPDVRSHVPGGNDAFWIPAGGIKLHPLSYALKTFDVGGHGEMVRVETSGVLAGSREFSGVRGAARWGGLCDDFESGGGAGVEGFEVCD